MNYPKLIENLIEKLSKLPGIGRRSAERIVFWLLNHSQEDTDSLCEAIAKLKNGLMFCRLCNNLTETEICLICSDAGRDQRTICVVEDPKDVLAIERTGVYRGLYHVLLGNISPADGRGPEDLKIDSLYARVGAGEIKEIVIATNPNNEGEMTSLFLSKQLSTFPVKITRIGLGIPVGSAVQYVDLSTLTMSLTSRKEIKV